MEKWQKIFQFLYISRQNIADSFLSFLSRSSNRIYLLVVFTLNTLSWIFSFYMRMQTNVDLIDLHYNVDFGIDFIGEPKYLFILPFFGLMVFLLNFLVILSVQKSRYIKFIEHLLLPAAVIAHIFLLVSQVTIYMINFY